MNSAEAKKKIIKLMQNNNKEELIKFLQACSISADLRKEYEKFKDNESEYKYCWYVKSNHNYGYCINKNGKMILLKLKSTKQHKQKDVVNKNELKNNDDYMEIKLENGYIDGNNHPELSTSFDIYGFMKEAGWLDDDQSYILAENLKSSDFPHDRLEIHHINNNPNDNRDVNLVYLPRSIHVFAHKYEIDKKNYNLKLTEDEYKKVNAFIEHVLRG